jgi:RHS repeat-associated protein
MLPGLFAMIDARKTFALLLVLVAALLCTGPGNTAHAQAVPRHVSPMALPPPPIEPDMPVNGAQTVSQSVSGTMFPNELYNVSVTMKNTGNTDWTQSGKYVLVSFNPELNMTWGVNRIALPTSTVLSGATVRFNFQVRAPATPGSYAFQWIMMQEGVGSFGALSSMTVTVRDRINNAMPSVPSVPTQMQTGQRYDVSVTMVNNGETTWTRAQQYTLMSQSPYNNTTWGFNRVPLPVDNIAPGQSATFNFQVTAPGAPGSYAFQWGMQREAYGAFGASAAAVSVNVAAPPALVNDAQVVGMSAPARMVTGQGYKVAVTMKNTGTTTWTPGENYNLGSQNPEDNQLWGLSRVVVATPVAPGQQYTFNFPVTAPAAGSYTMQWRMLRELVEWFGARASSPVTVTENLGNVTFIHTDGLGSPVARTDGAGNVISRTRYEPYGYVASGATPTIGFTGHVNDADTGLTYMQQRYYDPVAGRFLSIDPVVTDERTGSGFNRYSYAENNPYAYIDPDGRESELIQQVFVPGKRLPPLVSPFSSPVKSSRSEDPLLKPWGGQNAGGAQTGTPGWDPDDDDDPRGRSRTSSRSRTDKSKGKNRSTDGDKPASDKVGKEIGKKIEKDLGSDARKTFHNMKERGAPDRSLNQLHEDARDVYRQHGADVPKWLK